MHNVKDILDQFKLDKPKKKVFGNYRIEKNSLIWKTIRTYEINDYTYILAYIEDNGHRQRVHFVNIETGARYNEPFTVNSINKITSSELNLPRNFKKL